MRNLIDHFRVIPLRPTGWVSRVCGLVAATLLAVLGPGGVFTPSAGGSDDPTATAPTAAAPAQAVQPIPAFRQASNLAVLTIEGEIDGVTAHSFKRRLKAAIDAGADGVAVELNTPGGEVNAVIDICKALKGCGKHTIAWIRPDAYSGGAIIALACKEIVVAPGATMGDAAPVMPGFMGMGFFQGLHRTERAKALSPVLVEVVDSARANGYDEHLVQGFVTLGVELWKVEDTQTGKKYFLTEQEYAKLFGRDPERGNPVVPSLGEAQKADPLGTVDEEADMDQPIERIANPNTAFRPASPEISNKIVNELNSEVTGLSEASRRPEFRPEQAPRFRDLGYATDGQTLLTIKEQTIKDFGLAVKTIATDQELEQFTGAKNLRRLDQSWSETMVAFMTTGMSGMAIRGILIVVFLISLFLELSMPGATIPGIVALIALAGLIVPPMLVGAAAWWALAAIAVGIALILLEVFVLPGFGIPGIAGLLLLLGGLVGTFADAGELFPGSGKGGSDLSWALSVVLLAFFTAIVGMFLFSKYTRSFPIAGRMVLANPVPADDGEGLLAAMAATPAVEGPVRPGQIGRATTDLRPSGTAEFGDKLVDVVAEYGFIERGRAVRVIASGFRVSVEAVRDDPGTPAPDQPGREARA